MVIEESKNKIQKNKLIEYAVESFHSTSTIHHELLFSLAKRRFIKPAYGNKDAGKLVYKLLPGTYAKFGLFVSTEQNYAHFVIMLIRINSNGNIESKGLFEAKVNLQQILNDLDAPQVLQNFLEMMPDFNSTAIVIENNFTEDFQTILESIKKYFDRSAS